MIDPRVAVRPHPRELAVTGDRDLGARIATLGDVAVDQLVQVPERRGVETELGGRGKIQGKTLSHGDPPRAAASRAIRTRRAPSPTRGRRREATAALS